MKYDLVYNLMYWESPRVVSDGFHQFMATKAVTFRAQPIYGTVTSNIVLYGVSPA